MGAIKLSVRTMLSVSVVALAVSLAACTSSDSGSPGAEPKPAPQGTETRTASDDDKLRGIRFSTDVVKVGQLLELRFSVDALRGVAFTLERDLGGTWVHEFWLMSDRGGNQPFSARASEPFGWDDIGISGAGPDTVLIPADAVPGRHRVCTANARPEVCGVVELLGP